MYYFYNCFYCNPKSIYVCLKFIFALKTKFRMISDQHYERISQKLLAVPVFDKEFFETLMHSLRLFCKLGSALDFDFRTCLQKRSYYKTFDFFQIKFIDKFEYLQMTLTATDVICADKRHTCSISSVCCKCKSNLLRDTH